MYTTDGKIGFDVTIDNLYDIYGVQESPLGVLYLVFTDSSSTLHWTSKELYELNDSTLPSGWVEKKRVDPYGNKTTISSYALYFQFEEDIINATIRGSLVSSQMRRYTTEGYGIQATTRIITEYDINKKRNNKVIKEGLMKLPNEDEAMYLARVVAREIIGICNSLPEIMQWRIGSALQGDAYDMSSSVAAAKGSVDIYDRRAELESARSKVYVVRNALGLLPVEGASEGLPKKMDELVVAIDDELKAVNVLIQAEEQDEFDADN